MSSAPPISAPHEPPGSGPLAFGPFILDPAAGTLLRDGQPVPAQPRVIDLLAALAGSPGEVLSREALVARVWQGTHVTANVLDQALRKARQALGDDPASPRYIEVVPRRGWRFVAPVQPLRRAGSGLVGRERELGRLLAALARPGAVVLRGPGGVGKTRLALEAMEQSGPWPGGAWRVELQGLHGMADLAFAIQGALGLAVEGGDPMGRIGAALSARGRCLLVLDEAENLVEPVLEAMQRIGAPELGILVTSRLRLGALPEIQVEPLPPRAARELLLARVPAGVELLDDAAVEEVLAHLDGLPLAIELAAGRLKVVGPADLAARLGQGLRVLSGGGRSIEASLLESWQALSLEEQQVLCACAAPGRAFAAKEIEDLLPEIPVVLDALDRLQDASLLRGPPGALVLLDTVRGFAQARAEDAGWRARLDEAWAERVLERAGVRVPKALSFEGPALTALFEQRGDLVQVARSLPKADRRRPALAIALALALRYVGPWSLAREQLEAAAATAPEDPLLQAILGEYRLRTGAVGEGIEALERALATSEPSPQTRAHAGFLLARVRAALGELDEAGARARMAAEDARQGRVPALEALALDAAGLVRAARGDLNGAAARYAEAVARASGAALAGVRGLILQNHAACLGRAGRHAEARPLFAAAAEALGSLPFPQLAGTARGNLGEALLHTGQAEDARLALDEAIETARRVGDRQTETALLVPLGLAALLAGRPEDAERALKRLERLVSAPDADLQAVRLRALVAWSREERDRAEAALALGRVLAQNERDRGEILLLDAALSGDAALRAEGEHLAGSDHPLAAVLRGEPPRTGQARVVAALLRA